MNVCNEKDVKLVLILVSEASRREMPKIRHISLGTAPHLGGSATDKNLRVAC